MNNDYCVYKHTTPNGMVYIGITNQEPEERWLNGRGYKQNPSFFNAILLYGWANIKHEIICSGISKETASQKEKELIQIYHSNESEHGFNLSEYITIRYFIKCRSEEPVDEGFRGFQASASGGPSRGLG